MLSLNIVLGANTAHFNRNISKATKKAEQDLKGLAGFAQKTFDRFGALNVIGGALSARNIIQTADSMQELASQVRINTKSHEEYKNVLNNLRDISRENYASFDATVDLYAQSKRALDSLGKSQAQVLTFTENITKAMAVGGGSAASQQAALTQLAQALNMGALKGQEFNSVASQAPVLIDLLTQKLGVSIDQLKKMGSEGKITAEVIYSAVADAGDALDAKMAMMPVTISQALSNIGQEYKNLVHDLVNENSRASALVVSSLNFVTQNFKTLTAVAGVAGAVVAGNYAKSMLYAKLGADSMTVSLMTKTKSLYAAIAAETKAAYSQQQLTTASALFSQQKKIAARAVELFDTATTKAYVNVSATSTVMMNYARANFTLANAKSVATASVMSFIGAAQSAALTTSQYVRTTFTLSNAKAVLSKATASSIATVNGWRTSAATAVGAGVAYARSLTTVAGAKKALTGAATLASNSITATALAMKKATIDATAYTVRLATANATKKALVGTTVLATKSVTLFGRGLKSVGAIIMAHPIMIIGGIIAAIAVRTMSLEKAMESLGDAFDVSAEILGRLIDWGIDGFGRLWDATSEFLSNFGIGSKQTTENSQSYFAKMFADTEGGFVGMMQVSATMFDKMTGFAVGFAKYSLDVFNKFKAETINLFTSLGDSVANYFLGKINGIIDGLNWVNSKLGGDKDYISHFELKSSELLKVPDAVFAMGTGTNLRGKLDGIIITNKLSKEAKAKAEAQADGGGVGGSGGATGKGGKDAKGKDKKDKEKEYDGRLVGISGNSGTSTGAHLDIRLTGGGRRLTAEELSRFKADGKDLSAYKITSDFGRRKAPKAGASRDHRGIDYAMKTGTAITTTHAVEDVEVFHQKGGGWVSRVKFADGLSVDLLHLAPESQQVKRGASAKAGDKYGNMVAQANNEYNEMLEQQAKKRDEILSAYSWDGLEKIALERATAFKELSEAGFSEEDFEIQKANIDEFFERKAEHYLWEREKQKNNLIEFAQTEEQAIKLAATERRAEILFNHEFALAKNAELAKAMLDAIDFREEYELTSLKITQDEKTRAIQNENALIKVKDSNLQNILRIEQELADKQSDINKLMEVAKKHGSDMLAEKLKMEEADLKRVHAERYRNELTRAYYDILENALSEEEKLTRELNEQLEVLIRINAERGKPGAPEPSEDEPNPMDLIKDNLRRKYGIAKPEMHPIDKLKADNEALLAEQTAFNERMIALEHSADESRRITAEQRRDLIIYNDELVQQKIEENLRARYALMEELAVEHYDAILGTLKSFVGENNRVYQALFTLQRSYAVGKALMNMWEAGSKAFAETPGTIWNKSLAAAAAVARGGQFVALLKAVQPVGQAHDGIPSVPREGTWILDKGERVVKPRDNDRLTKFLDNPNRFMRSEPKIIINNYSGEPATATQDQNGDLIVTIGKMVGDAIDYKLAERDAKSHRQGWGY
ncbi:tape measure protein [Moraxella canis]|uniref:tape measure protein n=1 Tax=Moraxella canis TaxID=90239 RepID=UPI000666F1AE|nr:tape measure protein [Moraxella canis]